jgi:hypothetical protein
VLENPACREIPRGQAAGYVYHIIKVRLKGIAMLLLKKEGEKKRDRLLFH